MQHDIGCIQPQILSDGLSRATAFEGCIAVQTCAKHRKGRAFAAWPRGINRTTLYKKMKRYELEAEAARLGL